MIKTVDGLDYLLRDEAWDLYSTAFHELNAYAVQRHLMFRSEFDTVMDDPRVRKYLAFTDLGRLVGLSTYTNDLHSMPLIAPEYFQRRWPEQYDDRNIWYCGFVGVHPDAHATGVFAELVEAMWRDADGGLICLDMCRHNDQHRRLSRAIPLMLYRLAGDVRTERLDEQSFWMYETPAPAPA